VALNGGEFGDENIIASDTPFQSTLVNYMRHILCISSLLLSILGLYEFKRRVM
jgi:hypothetical protein